MSDLGNFLRELRGKRSLRDAAKLSGLSHTYIADIEKGIKHDTKAPVKPSPDALKKLADAYHHSYPDLMYRAGYIGKKERFPSLIGELNIERMKENSEYPHEGVEKYGLSKVNLNNYIDIPLLGKIHAGDPIDRLEYLEGYIPVDPITAKGKELFSLRVEGESMNADGIHDGYVVIVEKTPEVDPSDIAVVAVDDDYATLKRVQCKNGICVLSPSNPEMEPIIIRADKVQIIGKVLYWHGYPRKIHRSK